MRSGYFNSSYFSLGNNPIHRFLLPLMERWPGVVTHHDPICREQFGDDWESVLGKLLDKQRAVVVHADCNLPGGNLSHIRQPSAVGGPAWVRIPFGADRNPMGPGEKTDARRKHNIPGESWLVGLGGIAHPTKLTLDAIAAFCLAKHRRYLPSHARLVVIGPTAGGDWERDFVSCLRREDIHLIGQLPADEFADLSAACDVGVTLRRPPTRGETSAAMWDFVRAGVPTVVSDVGTFSEMPDSCVVKVQPVEFGPRQGIEGVALALGDLWHDKALYSSMSQACLRLTETHSWERVAREYMRLLVPKPRVPLGQPHCIPCRKR